MGNSKTRQNALIVLGFGAVLIVAGAVVGLVPFDSICGSAFFGLERTTSNQLDEVICASRHAGLIPVATRLLIVGALTAIISGVVAGAARPAEAAQRRELADELQELAGMRAAGQLSDDEYAAAKRKLELDPEQKAEFDRAVTQNASLFTYYARGQTFKGSVRVDTSATIAATDAEKDVQVVYVQHESDSNPDRTATIAQYDGVKYTKNYTLVPVDGYWRIAKNLMFSQ